MQGRWAGWVVLCLLVGLAGIALLVTELSGSQPRSYSLAQRDPASFSTESSWSGPDIFLGGRSEFKICVDRVGANGLSTIPEDRKVVQGALDQAFASLPRVPTEYEAPTLVLGCPHPTLLSGKLVDYRHRNTLRDASQIIGDPSGPAAPSPYRVLVYLTDPAAYRSAFGTEAYASSSEEFLCQSICNAVTRAIYMPLDNVQVDALKIGVLEVLYLLNEQEARDLLQREMYPTATATPISTAAH